MQRASRPLPRKFYLQPTLVVARELLGKELRLRADGRILRGRIVEVEAYLGTSDRAAHSAGGRRTPRNEAMWGPPGRAYVYFVYGMHWCLNAVTKEPGTPEAVLIRALEPLQGHEIFRSRRPVSTKPELLLSGPANLCKAFGIDRNWNGCDLTRGPLTIRDGDRIPDESVQISERVGVGYAGEDAHRPWRFFVGPSQAVSARPKGQGGRGRPRSQALERVEWSLRGPPTKT